MEMHYEDGAGTSLSYQKKDDHIVITGCQAKATIAEIPELLEELPVIEIAKKAFLGCKRLRMVRLPKMVTAIGEWAFGFCSALEEIYLPKRNISFGQGCFHKDRALRRIYLEATGQDSLVQAEMQEQTASLLAATVKLLHTEYLLEPAEAGSAEWLAKWDLTMRTFLAVPDEEGYQKMVLCGEEDLSANLDEYLADRRRKKAEVCFIRLMNPQGLNSQDRELLTDYLKMHQKGCESEAAWETVLMEHGDEKEYYSLLLELGCVTGENLELMLTDMGDRHAEMKAYLINGQNTNKENHDFFGALSLDL